MACLWQSAGKTLHYHYQQKDIDRINSNVQHVLHRLLPPPSVASQHYELRRRAHSRELPARTGRLTESNFVNRVLFADIY